MDDGDAEARDPKGCGSRRYRGGGDARPRRPVRTPCLDVAEIINASTDQRRAWKYFDLVLDHAAVPRSESTERAIAEMQEYQRVWNLWENVPDFVARANRQKPNGIAATESIVKWHLLPALGAKRLDAIANEQVQKLKLALAERAPKTVNNVLTVLSTLLKKAVEEDDGVPRLR